ncbi:MAG: HAMP domain-containing histidine kinase [Lachnospiraceae bacterium]|nr:HAMP domain-containing histidine kinase [Lachnospiraceae bacterium]
MNRKLIIIGIVFIVIIGIASAVILFLAGGEKKAVDDRDRTLAVSVNEIRQNIIAGDDETALEACDSLTAENEKQKNNSLWLLITPLMISVVAVIIMLIYLDRQVLKPFRDLKEYAAEVSKGNLEVPLNVSRGNYFGDFTWAFDNMRHELIKARAAEREAVQNNKTVIATLSHDIKTPIASVRAYAEAFEANMDTTPEKKQKYLSTIMQKCDEVTKLTNDLFLHSISEMDRLEVHAEQADMVAFMGDEVSSLFVDEGCHIRFVTKEGSASPEEMPAPVYVSADKKRLLQIMENLKNNSEKYAKTKIEIEIDVTREGEAQIHFRDFGPGIPEEEIPFITGKFYRGKNAGQENGSGLGLYIVSELMRRMNGKLSLYNKNPGLDAVLTFALSKGN